MLDRRCDDRAAAWDEEAEGDSAAATTPLVDDGCDVRSLLAVRFEGDTDARCEVS